MISAPTRSRTTDPSKTTGGRSSPIHPIPLDALCVRGFRVDSHPMVYILTAKGRRKQRRAVGRVGKVDPAPETRRPYRFPGPPDHPWEKGTSYLIAQGPGLADAPSRFVPAGGYDCLPRKPPGQRPLHRRRGVHSPSSVGARFFPARRIPLPFPGYVY